MSVEKDNLFYGPVASRRFGYSLGVDLIPYKVCSFDCIYCQLGKTTVKTLERKRYKEINLDFFLSELENIIKEAKIINYITFSGSGEPTLNSDIGILINNVKKITDIPVLVLTNGSTLNDENVIGDLKNADLVKVSLDACSEKIFNAINKPCSNLNFDKIIDGLNVLSQNFNGRIWLEIMLLQGINDSLEAATEFKKILNENNTLSNKIEKIHLNTPVRPSGVTKVSIPDLDDIEFLKEMLGSKAEIINQNINNRLILDSSENNEEIYRKIIKLAKIRPVTIRDLSFSLGININETAKFLRVLLNEKKLSYRIYKNARFYHC